MRRTGAEARQRILEAARDEFTRHGVDGARIDRIARNAGASKERLYAYFGDKQALFDEAVRGAIERSSMAVDIEANDLVTYAGRLAAYFFRHPDDLRMMAWIRLDAQCERALMVDSVLAHQELKLAAVRRAQAAGIVDATWDPGELLQVILAISTFWAKASGTDGLTEGRCVEVVQEAVRRLVAPAQ
ncbi:TetR family transcriptional regulator [Streptomyces muensis]|uniref:TetR family transcriptional regulator n=1 Tax=Streptomyces muensis TaxID=1077944 RepID=A0A9X1PW42_STRM4|nr:TetR family transcriptional regulator [Streptomyces muensis]MCF1592356.1 TetR family transcriptional regulator [Streptomyces muensis]